MTEDLIEFLQSIKNILEDGDDRQLRNVVRKLKNYELYIYLYNGSVV